MKESAASALARPAAIRRVLQITLALNLAVCAAKIAAGLLSNTLSLVADGYHSLLDGSGNILGLVMIHIAHKPPDEDHQYGHRKFEVIGSMGISLLLFAAAGQIVMESISRMKEKVAAAPTGITIATALVTLAVNVFVTRYEGREGRRLRSPFLLADAQHTLSDVYATCGVLAAILLTRAGIPWADPLAAVAIAGVILHAGYGILAAGLHVVSDRRVMDPGRIEAIATSFEGVRSCRRIRTRGFEDAAFLDLTLGLDPALSLREAHDLCDRIEERLSGEFPQLADILIHPEPEGAPGRA